MSSECEQRKASGNFLGKGSADSCLASSRPRPRKAMILFLYQSITCHFLMPFVLHYRPYRGQRKKATISSRESESRRHKKSVGLIRQPQARAPKKSHLLERNEARGVCRADTGSPVLDRSREGGEKVRVESSKLSFCGLQSTIAVFNPPFPFQSTIPVNSLVNPSNTHR